MAGVTTTIAVKTDQRLAAWRRAARKLNMNQSEWMRSVLDAASGYDDAKERKHIKADTEKAREEDADKEPLMK